MTTRRTFLAVWLGCLAALAEGSATAQINAAEPKVRLAIVVAKDSPVSDISFYELRRLYLGEHVSSAGRRLIALNLAPLSKERVAFDRSVLGMSAEAVARYWIDRKIRGQSGPPRAIDSPQILQRAVGRLEGSIGYVSADDVRDDVKVVRVDGHLPQDPGYAMEF